MNITFVIHESMRQGIWTTRKNAPNMTTLQKSNFNRLIGIWKTEGTILADQSVLSGTDNYEFILHGNYILHKANVTMGDEKSETFELISLDQSSDRANMHYYNAKAESGVMKSSLIKNNYIIEGEKMKFEGSINDGNTVLTGTWYTQNEHGKWTGFIELKLTKLH